MMAAAELSRRGRSPTGLTEQRRDDQRKIFFFFFFFFSLTTEGREEGRSQRMAGRDRAGEGEECSLT